MGRTAHARALGADGMQMAGIVHLVDADLARGAQRGAQMLVDQLAAVSEDDHRLATIFDAPPAALTPHIELRAPDGRARAFGLSPVAIRRLRASAELGRADVVVAHGGEALKYAVAAGLEASIVYHKIGVVGRRFTRMPNRTLHRRAVAHADRVVAISDAVRTEAIDTLGVATDRVTVIPNARDPRRYRPADGTSAEPVGLVFVGHLTRTKRPHWFIDASVELRARGHRLTSAIAGDGPLTRDVRIAAAEAGVRVLGRCDDVPGLLGRADVFAFPSMPEGEGMPGVLIEAAMSGAVCVATDVPGARDVVLDGVGGTIVAPDRFDHFVDALDALLSDEDLRRRMAIAAREHAITTFRPDVVAGAWDSVCGSLARESACASSI